VPGLNAKETADGMRKAVEIVGKEIMAVVPVASPVAKTA
jgi:hypothetical protein